MGMPRCLFPLPVVIPPVLKGSLPYLPLFLFLSVSSSVSFSVRILLCFFFCPYLPLFYMLNGLYNLIIDLEFDKLSLKNLNLINEGKNYEEPELVLLILL